ncbi:RNHCP domain-containing protein [Candidatus Nomurabacteria bacterium]|nr:RNHCP domain-containing protein [Candidatus Nomurabacteria bacterium]
MSSKKYQKNIENFICEKCGFSVVGGGYTNHCPKCLWSKHVDINPGDRKSSCGGLMKPTEVEFARGKYSIIHTCIKCGHQKKNIISKDDDFNLVIQVSKMGK